MLLLAINSKSDFKPLQLGFRRSMDCIQANHIVSQLMKQAVGKKKSPVLFDC